MIVSAAIASKGGEIFHPDFLPIEVTTDISEHARNFLFSLSTQDDDTDLPFIESTHLRYIYKQTGDLYWILVTKIESELLSDINLLGRFVCTIMEYGASETNSNTLTHQQRDLFYRHIWRPWDTDSCVCGDYISPKSWEREFENRLQFLVDIRNGQVNDETIVYYNALIQESWSLYTKLSPKEALVDDSNDLSSDSDSACLSKSLSHSIGEETIIECCRVKCRLDDIRTDLTRCLDPYLRLFTRNLLQATRDDEAAGSAPAYQELDITVPCDQDWLPK